MTVELNELETKEALGCLRSTISNIELGYQNRFSFVLGDNLFNEETYLTLKEVYNKLKNN